MPRADRAEFKSIAGIRFKFAYLYRRCLVQVAPSSDDLAAAPPEAVLGAWRSVNDWAARFCSANPGWRVNGRRPKEDDP